MTTRRFFLASAMATSLAGFINYHWALRDRTLPIWFRHIAPSETEFRSLSLLIPEPNQQSEEISELLTSLKARLSESETALPKLELLSQRKKREVLSLAIRKDYMVGDTIEIHGWILSRTEHLILRIMQKKMRV